MRSLSIFIGVYVNDLSDGAIVLLLRETVKQLSCRDVKSNYRMQDETIRSS